MNWLSHLYLSEPNPAFRIGNLLPDLAPMSALSDLPSEFLRGIKQHRRIDAFTDSHAIFRRSISRVGPEFRRYGGILVDIFLRSFSDSGMAGALCRAFGTVHWRGLCVF